MPKTQNHRYASLPEEEREGEYTTELHRVSILSSPHRRNLYTLILLLSITTVLLVGALATALSYAIALQRFSANVKIPNSSPKYFCGATIDEAEANFCKWDELTKTWLPSSCPTIYNEQYIRSAPNSSWRYWADPSGQIPIPDISTLAIADNHHFEATQEYRDTDWYTTNGEHAAHCAFVVLRHIHALTFGTRMDRISGQWKHVEHCMEYLLEHALESPGSREIEVRSASGFGWC